MFNLSYCQLPVQSDCRVAGTPILETPKLSLQVRIMGGECRFHAFAAEHKNCSLPHDMKLEECVFAWALEGADRSVSTGPGCPALLSSFNSGETVLFSLHIKRSLNEMKSSSFNKQHKYLILF